MDFKSNRSDLESNEARHPEANMKVGLHTPQIKCTPLDMELKDNDFWHHFGPANQPGMKPESTSNG